MFDITQTYAEETHEMLLNVTFDEAAVQDEMRKLARRLARQINIPGFRRGRAPYNIVLRYVGEETLRQESAESLLDTHYAEIIEKAGITPYDAGRLEDLQLNPLTCTIRVPLKPVVELSYDGLPPEPEPVEVTEEEIAAALEDIREAHARLEPVERPAQEGDQAHIVMHIRPVEETTAETGEEVVEPSAFEDEADITVGKTESHPIPEVPAALLGMQPGEEKRITAIVPDSFEASSVAGKRCTITLKLEQLAERVLPPLDDDLALAEGGYESLEALKEAIRQRLLQEKQAEAASKHRHALIDALIEHATLRYPPLMVEEQIDAMMAEINETFQERYHLDLNDYIRLQGISEEQFRDSLRKEAEGRVKSLLVITTFARDQGIEVDEAEVTREYEQILERFPYLPRDVSEEIEQERKRSLRADLYMDKIYQRLLRIARGETPSEPEAGAPPSEET